MKYKNRLTIPTLLTITMLSTSLIANADEVEKTSNTGNQRENITEQHETHNEQIKKSKNNSKSSSKSVGSSNGVNDDQIIGELNNGSAAAEIKGPDNIEKSGKEDTNNETDTYTEESGNEMPFSDEEDQGKSNNSAKNEEPQNPPNKKNQYEADLDTPTADENDSRQKVQESNNTEQNSNENTKYEDVLKEEGADGAPDSEASAETEDQLELEKNTKNEENQLENTTDKALMGEQDLKQESKKTDESETKSNDTNQNSDENTESEGSAEAEDQLELEKNTKVNEDQFENATDKPVMDEQDLKQESKKTDESETKSNDTNQNSDENMELEKSLKEKKNKEIHEEDPNEEEKQLESDKEKFEITPMKANLNSSLLKAEELPYHKDVVYAAKVKNSNNSGRYSPVGSNTSKPLGWLENRTLFITAETVDQGTKYYRIHSGINGPLQGWVKEEDLSLFDVTQPKNHNKSYDIKLEGHHLLTDPWGSANQHINRLDHYGDHPFHAEHVMELGAHTYYYGKIGNDKGWLEKSRLVDTSTNPYYNHNVFHAARINSGENSGRYSPVTSNNSKELGWLENRTLFITSEAKYQGTRYYKIHSGIDGPMQGWVKSEDVRLYNTQKPTAHENDYSIHLKGHHLLTDPWGTANQYIKRLGEYGDNGIFSAEKSIEIGNHTYFYGKIGNDHGWLEQSRVKEVSEPSQPSEPETSVVKYDQSLNSVLNTQMSLSTKPQAWASGGGWRNATRNEVRYYLNPANHTSDTWDYTFLDLNRAQNISSTELNNQLLSGKGMLHNQGAAFLQAANTHGVNEVYLISHALHETGNGESTLAQGVSLDVNGNISSNGELYYNMYGIGAYDNNAVLGGARYAQRMGWDTPAKSIIGGAQFISSGYFNRGQTTLYSMRWNPENPGTYQYATDVNWAYATARNLQNYYNQLGLEGRYYTRYTF